MINSILTGHLLGDGSLQKNNNSYKRNYYFNMTSKYKEYLEWIINSSSSLFSGRPIWNFSTFDNRTNKTYYWFGMKSLTSKKLTTLRAKWYPQGIKEIPLDLKLDKISLLRWFMDDGSKATNGGNYLATDGCRKEEIEFIKTIVKRDLSLETSLHKNGSHFRLYFNKAQSNNFYKLLGPCPVNSFNYKW